MIKDADQEIFEWVIAIRQMEQPEYEYSEEDILFYCEDNDDDDLEFVLEQELEDFYQMLSSLEEDENFDEIN